MLRTIGRGLAVAALLLALTPLAALGWRAWAQHRNAEAFAIRTPNGIDEERFVRIDRLDQWITIRGDDRRKPVLLLLHGGPGAAQSFLIGRMRPLERHYVVVQWDQPGAGRTLTAAGGKVSPALDTATMVRDGIAVSEYVRARLGRDRIVLVGWSWGSDLGVRMAQARPDLYAAYVGTGQAASAQPERDRWDYAYLSAQAAAAHDAKALETLKEVGPPPWKDHTAPQRLWRIAGPYSGPNLSAGEGAMAALTAPHWTLADVAALSRGRSALGATTLEREIWATDFATFGATLKVPVLLIQGERDTTAPTDHARAWLVRLRAPAKAMVVIPAAGHQVLITHTAAFARALDAQAPLLLSTPTPKAAGQ